MAKIVYIAYREGADKKLTSTHFKNLSQRLLPDNIEANSPQIIDKDNLTACILNPNESVSVKDTSVCLGNMLSPCDNWWQPGSQIPDGTYSIIRADNIKLEILTDVLASRSIWYAQTDELFVASSSQRAIIAILQSFVPDNAVYTWMLANGNLGPYFSWDKRIKLLLGDSKLVLNFESWRIDITSNVPEFTPEPLSKTESQNRLKSLIESVIDSMDLNYSKWMLTLSGGVDSRALLMFLNEKTKINCVTWGSRYKENEKMNDASLAKALADHFKQNHLYLNTDISTEPIEDVFERYIVCSEGRVDHIAGYMDGFAVWQNIFQTGTHGVIRGDEVFGGLNLQSHLSAYHRYELYLMHNYAGYEDYKDLGLEEQVYPDRLTQRENETFEQWRDRLDQEFYVPVVLSALNEIKAAYVEIANPLLCRRIITEIRSIPDEFRTNKELFESLVLSMSPDIPIARFGANISPNDIFRTERFESFLIDELESIKSLHLFSSQITESAINDLKSSSHTGAGPFGGLFLIAKKLVPDVLKAKLRKSIMKIKLDYRTLAFRIYIIGKTYKMLKEDAELFKK